MKAGREGQETGTPGYSGHAVRRRTVHIRMAGTHVSRQQLNGNGVEAKRYKSMVERLH